MKVATVSKGKSMLRAGEKLKAPDHFVFKFPKTGSYLPRTFSEQDICNRQLFQVTLGASELVEE